MGMSVTEKLVSEHLVDGTMEPGSEVALRVDQTLTQDATGTLVMLELEALGLDRVKTEVSVQYVDHNLIQEDHRNPDDHEFLRSACRRYGIWYSRPGNGVSHPLHQERFGIPGKTLLGSDSHTTAAGSMGMLAMGAGGIEVALAMAGEPYRVRMPRVRGVELTGSLPDWVSAKDVALEMLRRHGVSGHVDWIVEYHGQGLDCLTAMDRHVIANMGTELGATTSVFPSDGAVRRFMERHRRGDDWVSLEADEDAAYDERDRIDLSSLEPLIALPSSPGNVVPVREVEGRDIYQAYLGSSANPGFRDFAVPALMVRGRTVADGVSFDVNPASRGVLDDLDRAGYLGMLIRSGARLHQAGCNGCIGMGQAPATGRNSLRTVPRNFAGRSGTKEDSVYLCSPETATASALTGRITDPRDLEELLDIRPPEPDEPERPSEDYRLFMPPPDDGADTELVKGPNIKSLPDLPPLPDRLEGPALITLGDDCSTDDILPGGTSVLPFRSNIDAISRFVFHQLDEEYPERALDYRDSGHFIVAGANYGQGSSREHAALAPRHLGVKAVLAESYARIHVQNLANFGVVPLLFEDPEDRSRIEQGDELEVPEVRAALKGESGLRAVNRTRDEEYPLRHELASRQVEMVLAGGILNLMEERRES